MRKEILLHSDSLFRWYYLARQVEESVYCEIHLRGCSFVWPKRLVPGTQKNIERAFPPLKPSSKLAVKLRLFKLLHVLVINGIYFHFFMIIDAGIPVTDNNIRTKGGYNITC